MSRTPTRTVFSGGDLGRVAEDVAERLRAQAEQRGQRHAVDVAGGRGVRGVDVGVGVDPDQADLLPPAAVKLGHAGDRAGGQGVVAAQHQRRHALFEGLDHGLGGARAGFGDLLQIAGVSCCRRLGFGNLDADVAAIGDLVAEGFKARFEAGHAHGRGAHVHAAAAGAHVEGHADDANAARRRGALGKACWSRHLFGPIRHRSTLWPLHSLLFSSCP